MANPVIISRVIEKAVFDAARQRGLLSAVPVEERQEERRHNEQGGECEAAAIGRPAMHFFHEQGADNMPAHIFLLPLAA